MIKLELLKNQVRGLLMMYKVTKQVNYLNRAKSTMIMIKQLIDENNSDLTNFIRLQ